MVSLMTAGIAAQAQSLPPGPLEFVMSETTGVAGPRVATVSFPFARGEVAALPGVSVTGKTGTLPAQCRVLQSHPDGSVRRALVRFIWSPQVRQSEAFKLNVLAAAPKTSAQVTDARSDAFSLKAGGRTVRSEAMGLVIGRGGKDECRVGFRGVEFPQRFLGPEVRVIEDGPYFSWVSLTYYGGYWNVCAEVQADATGQVRVIERLRRTYAGAVPIPPFGAEVSGLPASLTTDKPQTLPFTATVADGPCQFQFGTTTIILPDGPQTRQGRISVDGADGGSRFTLLRDASLDNTVADEHKQFREGQERAVELLLPPAPNPLTCAAEIAPQRRCAAVLGKPLVSYGKLQRIRELNTEHALKLACRDGDQWGDLTVSVSRSAPKWSITGLTRIDTGLDMLEDYYRGGDARLRDSTVNWAENWVSLKQYRGWDMNSYGGERYTMGAWDAISSFIQKGIMMVAYAYEETGDPRYKEAALSFADRIVGQLKTRWFVAGTNVAPTAIGADANIRPAYMGRDLVLMYRWTGDQRYLDAARSIFHGLAALRTSGYGLLREGYSDPYSPFERLVTGTDLGVTEDNSDHLKPYILEYLIEGAQYVYEDTRDPVARETMITLSDFMLGAMQDGGFWNYAQRHAAEGNSIGHMTIEIANGLLKTYALTGEKRYRDAAFLSYHYIIKAFDTYETTLDGVAPPTDRKYFYPGDHCSLDFYRGSVGLDSIGRDPTAYLFTAMDRMLRIDPKADEFLLSPPTHPRHKWLVEQVPLGGLAVIHEIGHNWIARIDLGRDGDSETGGKSDLVLLEDGKPLGPGHSLHQSIRDEGQGHYSHWTRQSLYFSTSDNSDPLTNGRKYTWYFGSPDQIPSADQQQTIPTTNTAFGNRKPHPSVAIYERGLQAEREKRYEDAIAVWEEVLKQWPDCAPELYRQIALWEAAGKPEQMLATCRRFLKTFPAHDRAPEVRMRLVTWLLGNSQQGEAQALLTELAKSAQGTPWGEEAAVRLWRECGVGEAPATMIRAAKATAPKPQALTALRAADGLKSEVAPQIGAAYDDTNLYLKLVLPGAPADAGEKLSLFMDPTGTMTSYQVYAVSQDGTATERPAMWHNRLQGFVSGQGWQVKVTQGDGWTADVTIPFSKLGFSPEPGRHTWRLGYRWDSTRGMMLWRPAMPWYVRPHDCGWVVFE